MNPAPSPHEKGNILVVDDTPANLRLLVGLLSQKGYKVRAVPSGKLALSGIHASPPDLVLLDIMMPEMDGYEVCEALKADEQTRKIPVIFISALDQVFDKLKAFRIGGVDYITKPFQAEEVLARVETHLENCLLQRRLHARNQDLIQTIEQLQATQNQLIQSEKMASLGKLVAGIAHEINTPLGAIQASASNSSKALEESLGELPQLFERLSDVQQTDFFALVARSLDSTISLSSEEMRSRKRELARQLQQQEIEEARDIADTLIDMGFDGSLDPFIGFLKSSNIDWILSLAYNIVSLKINNNNILTAIERVAKIVFALKSYSHYDYSGEKRQIDIVEGLETVLELYKNQLKRGIEVVRDYQDPLPQLLAYPDELAQVWTNLVHNAIHAMEGKGTLKIAIAVLKRDAYREVGEAIAPEINLMTIQITDTGCGIPANIQEQIFEPFFTTKPTGEGSGLGLDIARKIVEKHEGKIEVDSQVGCTTFKVFLPI